MPGVSIAEVCTYKSTITTTTTKYSILKYKLAFKAWRVTGSVSGLS